MARLQALTTQKWIDLGNRLVRESQHLSGKDLAREHIEIADHWQRRVLPSKQAELWYRDNAERRCCCIPWDHDRVRLEVPPRGSGRFAPVALPPHPMHAPLVPRAFLP